MWTAIWTLIVFGLLLFLGDSILAFISEQLQHRRVHRLALERERTKQAIVAQRRDALVWHQLDGRDQPLSMPSTDDRP